MIEFLCPNGHKIHCPEQRAGLAAKCPRCGVRFRIPTLDEVAGGAAMSSDEPLLAAEADGSDVALAAGSAAPPPAPEPQIEFLCPRGHHLHGPANLQGKPGECPECGARFRIPAIGEVEAAAAQQQNLLGITELGEVQSSEGAAAAPAEADEYAAALPVMPDVGEASASGTPQPAAAGPRPLHPLAVLFARYWAARAAGSRVEVHLASGGVLSPDGYVPTPQQDHAVLVTQDPDGMHTVTIVPWDSVSRVILRGIAQVPGELVQ